MKLSLNDLVLISNQSRHQAYIESARNAILAEKLGFNRVWFTEHHLSPLSVCTAPELMIPFIAAKTKRIRIGSGAVLLNYYSPFKIAEQFNQLNEMFPDRVDLGVGNNFNGQLIDNAILNHTNYEPYNNKVESLLHWINNDFPQNHPNNKIFLPNTLSNSSTFILGSSVKSAKLAADNGLPYVFADFFSPEAMLESLKEYYKNFKSSSNMQIPYTILGLRVICAETKQELQKLLASAITTNLDINNNVFSQPLSPDASVKRIGGLPIISSEFRMSQNSPTIIIGTLTTIKAILKKKLRLFPIDEVMFQIYITDKKYKKKAIELLSTIN